MIKLACTISVLFFSFIATAQNAALGQSDPQAKKILDAVSQKFKSFKSVKASFTLKAENAAGKSVSSKTGTVLMKNTRYKVNITGQEIFCDGNNVWTYDKSAKEVQLSRFDNSASTITPQKIFTNFYDKDFLYKLNGEVQFSGKTVYEIEMTPFDKTKSFFKVYLYVDKKAGTIVSTKVLEKTGNRFIITVNSLNANVPVNDADFVFDTKKYPGVEVIDLR